MPGSSGCRACQLPTKRSLFEMRRSTANPRTSLRHQELRNVNALGLDGQATTSTSSWNNAPSLLERRARNNRQPPGVTATPATRVSLAHQEESSGSEECEAPVSVQRIYPRDRERILACWKRIMLRLDALLTHAARGKMIGRWDETRYETGPSSQFRRRR